MIKAVILIGGPMKGRTCVCVHMHDSLSEHFSSHSFTLYIFYVLGTRFRPLSLELPKPLFPIGGFPVVYHHIEACKKV